MLCWQGLAQSSHNVSCVVQNTALSPYFGDMFMIVYSYVITIMSGKSID